MERFFVIKEQNPDEDFTFFRRDFSHEEVKVINKQLGVIELFLLRRVFPPRSFRQGFLAESLTPGSIIRIVLLYGDLKGPTDVEVENILHWNVVTPWMPQTFYVVCDVECFFDEGGDKVVWGIFGEKELFGRALVLQVDASLHM